MTIAEYINNSTVDTINGIPFQLYSVNEFEDKDVDAEFPYEGDEIEDLSFLDRLAFARKEIEHDTKGMTKEEAFAFYKKQTDKDNINYWGSMVYVTTKGNMWTSDNVPEAILFGVRMD